MTTSTGRPTMASSAPVIPQVSSTPCPADRHGTADAYQHHRCRCATARRQLRRQVKRRQLAHLRGLPPLTDAAGARRRLQALAVLGYSLREIGSHLGRTPNTVHDWQTTATVVTRATAASVTAVYDRLADRPSTGPRVARVRNDALRKGWRPPIAWDDDVIDDPHYQPDMVLLENVADQVAIDRYLTGDSDIRLNRAEKCLAYDQMRAAGHTVNAVSTRLRLSGATARLYEASRLRDNVDDTARDPLDLQAEEATR